ncbi:hypothetical protein NLX83_04165 [Allokutzneria sp. A3M-2-11 16]|uniref:hypothetical protein n=1 Tax=Allokutzneria sp. A3M-2-11 16 TaxID=2962043 RepID=UPI0020B6A645|nr:hypothetical protein [Allokutzneria sp. A3M-2-11 16]MCP3798449.1 hypothetical protein [Allokutzneria sp. A3M-2-11 16]
MVLGDRYSPVDAVVQVVILTGSRGPVLRDTRQLLREVGEVVAILTAGAAITLAVRSTPSPLRSSPVPGEPVLHSSNGTELVLINLRSSAVLKADHG